MNQRERDGQNNAREYHKRKGLGIGQRVKRRRSLGDWPVVFRERPHCSAELQMFPSLSTRSQAAGSIPQTAPFTPSHANPPPLPVIPEPHVTQVLTPQDALPVPPVWSQRVHDQPHQDALTRPLNEADKQRQIPGSCTVHLLKSGACLQPARHKAAMRALPSREEGGGFVRLGRPALIAV